MKIVYIYNMFPEKMLRLIIASSMFVHSQSWPSSEQSPGIQNVYFLLHFLLFCPLGTAKYMKKNLQEDL
jgi:hypothetical protein